MTDTAELTPNQVTVLMTTSHRIFECEYGIFLPLQQQQIKYTSS